MPSGKHRLDGRHPIPNAERITQKYKLINVSLILVAIHVAAVEGHDRSWMPSVRHASLPHLPPPSDKTKVTCSRMGRHAIAIGGDTCGCILVSDMKLPPSPLPLDKQR